METKRKIEVGKIFSAKVAGTYMPVKITASLGHGRYESVVMPDGSRTVKVATTDLKGSGETVEKWTSRQRPQAREVAAPAPTSPALAVPSAAGTAPAAAKSKRGKRAAATNAVVPAADAKPKKTSGLDAAVIVLRAAGEPMNCGDLVKAMLDNDLWKTNGKTPSATLYSAIHIEIAKKGAASRFRKADRGMFELTEVGAAEATA